MKRKLTAMILVLVSLSLMLASCGKKNTSGNPDTGNTTTLPSAVVGAEDGSSANGTPSGSPDAATPAGQTANNPTATGSMTKEQIISLYNSSVNRVKKEATSLTRNYKKLESLPEYLELPYGVQTIGSAAIDQFVKGTDTPESWTTKEDIQIVFPVGGTDYSSHLTADMVKSATCTDTGSAYQIELKLYDDAITSPAKGLGYAGVFNTVTASTFEEINIPTVTFNSVKINGINGSISCTIDKSTNRVSEVTFRNTDILDLDVKVVLSSISAKFALAVEENYSVKY